jgi:hypothetical protein
MNPGVTVLTSQEITLEELKDVVLEAGEISGPELGAGNFGVFQQGDAYFFYFFRGVAYRRGTRSYTK